MATESSDGLFSGRAYWLLVALMLLLITTYSFTADVYAFFWSLIVLGLVVYLDD